MVLLKQLFQSVILFFLLKVEDMWDSRIQAKQKRIKQIKEEHEKLRLSPNESENRIADELFEQLREESGGLANLRSLYSAITSRSSDSDSKGGIRSSTK